MPEMMQNQFDLEGFVASIGQAIETVQQMERSRYVAACRTLPPSPDEIDAQRAEEALLLQAREASEKMLQDKTLLGYLCPALRSATADAFDISKILAAALVPLSLAGTLNHSFASLGLRTYGINHRKDGNPGSLRRILEGLEGVNDRSKNPCFRPGVADHNAQPPDAADRFTAGLRPLFRGR